MDLHYVLSHKEMAHYFLFNEDGALVTRWANVLKLVQAMDKRTNVRINESQPHAEFDSGSKQSSSPSFH